MTGTDLERAYQINSVGEVVEHYDGWADKYDEDLIAGGYITPVRCAEALAGFVQNRAAPLAEFGCGTGLSGAALKAVGFETIDGFDISQGMLDQANAKGFYRNLTILDLSVPFDHFPMDTYSAMAAIGVLNASFLPVTVLDEMLGALAVGGHLVCSLNDKQLADGRMEGRMLELCEYNATELVFKETGPHLPNVGMESSVYVLRKR